MDIVPFAKGLVIGFTIAAPVGPIGILCIRRTIVHGMACGFVSGIGAASADAVYGTIAAFGLTIIANFLIEQQFWLRLIGGLFLCYLAFQAYKAPVAEKGEDDNRCTLAEAYISTLVLTISNPMTIFSFIAVFAGLGLGSEQRDYLSAGLLVLGVFIGSSLWWVILSKIVNALRTQFDSRKLGLINKMAGAVLGFFGLLAVLSVFQVFE